MHGPESCSICIPKELVRDAESQPCPSTSEPESLDDLFTFEFEKHWLEDVSWGFRRCLTLAAYKATYDLAPPFFSRLLFAAFHSTDSLPAVPVILWSYNLANSFLPQGLPLPFTCSGPFHPLGLSLNNIL